MSEAIENTFRSQSAMTEVPLKGLLNHKNRFFSNLAGKINFFSMLWPKMAYLEKRSLSGKKKTEETGLLHRIPGKKIVPG